MYFNRDFNSFHISTMKSILVIWCLFALSDAISVAVPVEDYPTKRFYNDNEARQVQLIQLVANEEQLMNDRIGRQNMYGSIPLGNDRAPIQNYGGYVSNGYRNYQSYPNYQNYPSYQSYQSYPRYANYNRRNYQARRRKFGGIGSAIIV